MSDTASIRREVRRAELTDEHINDACARMIASHWHGGQATSMYSFASTGAIDANLIEEVRRELAATDEAVDRITLMALGYYVQVVGERGAQDGWSNLWLPDESPNA
jgi:hypothetical protein